MPRGRKRRNPQGPRQIENAEPEQITAKRRGRPPKVTTVTGPSNGVLTAPSTPGKAEAAWLKPGDGQITAKLPDGAEVTLAGPGFRPEKIKVQAPRGTVLTWIIVT